MISPFVNGRTKLTNQLIKEGHLIKPIKGIHRILDWHDLIKDGYVQKLAKNQWVLHLIPEHPTIEILDDLLKQTKSKKNDRHK